LLLSSHRVVPAALTRIGYRFSHSQLEPALKTILAS
jgi:NAD dependent epimerase/dehydratase family enzyme